MEPRATWRSVPGVVRGFRGRLAAAVAVAVGGASVAILAALVPVGDASLRATLGNATYLVPAIVVVALSVQLARRPWLSSRERRGWTLLTFAAGLNVIASVGWLVVAASGPANFDPTPIDLFFAAWSVVIVAAIWELRTDTPAPGMARRWLDVGVVVTAAVLVVLTTVVVPAADRPGGFGANLAEGLVYPLCDLGMVAIVAALLARPAPVPQATVFRLLGSGVLVYVAGDFFYAWRLMTGGPTNDAFATGLEAGGLAIIAIAVAVRLAQTRQAVRPTRAPRVDEPPTPDGIAPPTIALPYVAVLVAFALMLVAWVKTLDLLAQAMALSGYALVTLLLVRQRVVERDLSRLAALEAAQASEERFRFAFDRAPIGIMILRDEQVVYANDALRALIHFRPDQDIATLDWVEYVAPADRPRLVALYANRQLNQTRTVRTLVSLPDGTSFAIELDVATILLSGRVSLIVFVRDTTERDAAERAVRDSEERLRYVVEHAPFVTVFTDLEGRITSLAGALESSSGDSLLSHLASDIFPAAAAAEFDALRARVLETGAPVESEMVIPGPWGRPWCSIAVQPRQDEEGQPIGFVAYVRDLTQDRERDAERVEAQRLEGIGMLASGIAHDFNNLLVGILGNADYARSELPAGSHVRATVEDIEHAARRASELVSDLLAYSSGRDAPTHAVDLSALVGGLERLLRTAIPRQISLRPELAVGLPPVLANGTRLRQVVMNLVTNAGEAIGEAPGTITVETRAVWLPAPGLQNRADDQASRAGRVGRAPREGMAESGGGPGPEASLSGVALVVSDTGSGMDPAVRDRLFLPFFTTKFTGRGLGMWVVAGVVRSMGGTVEVDSEPGRGTRITVTLPSAVGAPLAEIAPPEPRPAGPVRTGARVLVVDDEPLVREVARRFLERGGYQATVADGGEAALKILAEASSAIDVILLDVSMPELDGPATFRQIVAQHPEMPVVLSSGHDGAHVAARFERAAGEMSPVGFVAKPYHAAELLASIAAALDHRSSPPA